MKITTINVNGIRAAYRKGMQQWLENHDADLLCLQETRASVEDTRSLLGVAWDTHVWPCRIKGRAGVALALRRDSGYSLKTLSLGLPAGVYDDEKEPDVDSGRWLEATVGTPQGKELCLVSAYLHAGALDTPRQEQKMTYLSRIDTHLRDLRESYAEVLVCGDFNVVRTQIDIKNWKTNHNKSSGVLDEEIAYLDSWMADSSVDNPEEKLYVDVTRALLPEKQGPYTWWSQRGKAFDNDAGWRIDYHMCSPNLAGTAQNVAVFKASSYEERFTDHAPLTINYEF